MEDLVLKGHAISEGIAIGTAFFFQPEERKIPEFSITLSEVDEEIARYRGALFSSREDLQALKYCLSEEEAALETTTIIDSHLHMLDDPLITEQMEERIRHTLQSSESVLCSVMHDYESRLKKTTPFFQQRLADVKDLAHRVLGHLCPSMGHNLSQVPFNSVVFAKELIPSQIASVDAARVAAFVTVSSGAHSHAALIARAKGIPYVGGIENSLWSSAHIRSVIVDGQKGEVILNPSVHTVAKYKQRKTRLKTSFHLLKKGVQYPVETMDGHPAFVYANLCHPDEWEALGEKSADGVGLFRSEYLFLERRQLVVSEEEQYQIYSQLVHAAEGLPVVIRVFDVGGDKTPQWMQEQEANPVLGCRGIRFLLRHPEVFQTQLRAILRAAAEGDVRVLLPMIADSHEMVCVKQHMSAAAASLAKEGKAHRASVSLGCMVELPSAVLLCDVLAKECDFFSIGTNDLAQYALGMDRNHPSMNNLCYPAHPSIIRMIKLVVMQAQKAKKEVTVCGEMASNPLCTPLLLGLGVNRFSCSLRYVPSIKCAVRNTSLLAAQELADNILSLGTTEEVMNALCEFEKAGGFSSHLFT